MGIYQLAALSRTTVSEVGTTTYLEFRALSSVGGGEARRKWRVDQGPLRRLKLTEAQQGLQI